MRMKRFFSLAMAAAAPAGPAVADAPNKVIECRVTTICTDGACREVDAVIDILARKTADGADWFMREGDEVRPVIAELSEESLTFTVAGDPIANLIMLPSQDFVAHELLMQPSASNPERGFSLTTKHGRCEVVGDL